MRYVEDCAFLKMIHTAIRHDMFRLSMTPVFSVTWSFRNHANVQIWCSRNI